MQFAESVWQSEPVCLFVEEVEHIELPGQGAQLFGAMPSEEHHRMLQIEAADELQNQLIGLFGLVALAAGTAVEAGLAAKKAYSVD